MGSAQNLVYFGGEYLWKLADLHIKNKNPVGGN